MGKSLYFSSTHKQRRSKLFYRLLLYRRWFQLTRDNSTGFTIVWGIYNGTGNENEQRNGPFSFPRSLSCHGIHTSLINSDSNFTAYDCGFQPYQWNNSQFWVVQQNYGGAAWFTRFFTTGFGFS